MVIIGDGPFIIFYIIGVGNYPRLPVMLRRPAVAKLQQPSNIHLLAAEHIRITSREKRTHNTSQSFVGKAYLGEGINLFVFGTRHDTLHSIAQTAGISTVLPHIFGCQTLHPTGPGSVGDFLCPNSSAISGYRSHVFGGSQV